jgi:hypothetical protein
MSILILTRDTVSLLGFLERESESAAVTPVFRTERGINDCTPVQ